MAKKRKKSAQRAKPQGELSEGELEQVAGGAWYAKFDGVDGSSSAAQKEVIEIESFSWGASQTGVQSKLGVRKK